MYKLFYVLIFVALFGCNSKKQTLLKERLYLYNITIEMDNAELSSHNEYLFKKLNPKSQSELDTIKYLSSGINNYLNNLKGEMINKSGGYNEEYVLVNDFDFSFPYNFIINSNHKLHFKDTINSLPLLISNLKIFETYPIVMDSGDDPYWSKLPDHRQIFALELIFGATNLSGALVSISVFQNKIMEYERMVYENALLNELDSLRANNQ